MVEDVLPLCLGHVLYVNQVVLYMLVYVMVPHSWNKFVCRLTGGKIQI